MTDTASLVIAALAVSMPTLLYKSIEYTAVALYLPCLLWAIWVAEKRRWGWFFLAWLLAFSSRQSAITWLVLPLVALVRCWFEGPPQKAGRPWGPPLLVLAGAAAAYALLSLGMNQTHSQAVVAQHFWERLNLSRSWPAFVFGASAFLALVGIGAFVFSWRQDQHSPVHLPPWKIFGLLAGAAALLIAWNLKPLALYFEHGCYGGVVGKPYVMLLLTVALAGWLTGGFAVRGEMILAGLGSLALVCLRTDVWDYYYIDVALFGFFTPLARSGNRTGEPIAAWPKIAPVAICALFFSLHLYFVIQLKLATDRGYALGVLAEKSLRADRLEVTELSFAPFGFIGWRLHPHYVAHDGRTNGEIGGFMRYLRPNAVETRFSPVRFWRDSRSLQPNRAGEAPEPIASDVFRVGWFWYQRCSLWRNPPQSNQPASLPFVPADYRPALFPQNGTEWQHLARGDGP